MPTASTLTARGRPPGEPPPSQVIEPPAGEQREAEHVEDHQPAVVAAVEHPAWCVTIWKIGGIPTTTAIQAAPNSAIASR